MKRLALVAAALALILGGPASARLGNTPDTQAAQYGPPQNTKRYPQGIWEHRRTAIGHLFTQFENGERSVREILIPPNPLDEETAMAVTQQLGNPGRLLKQALFWGPTEDKAELRRIALFPEPYTDSARYFRFERCTAAWVYSSRGIIGVFVTSTHSYDPGPEDDG